MKRTTVFGRELEYTEGTSDKYYSVLIVGGAFIAAWGRHGAAPQVKVYVQDNSDAAVRRAQVVTNDKAAKGYTQAIDFTSLTVESDVAARAATNDKTAVSTILSQFRNAARVQGNTTNGAK